MYVNGLPQTRKFGLCDYTTETMDSALPISVAGDPSNLCGILTATY